MSSGLPTCQTPAGQGFGSPAAPHTYPHPSEGGQASVLAGTQCARPKAASPEAQTWPAGRYVPSHASRSVFHLHGLRDSTRAQLRLSGRTAVLVGCHQTLGQPEQPGRGGRSGCSGAVAVLVSQRPAGSGEARAGKSMQLAQHPQERGPGCHRGGGSVPTLVAGSVPSGWARRHWGWWSGVG